MTDPHPLAIDYGHHPPVRELLDVVRYCLEDLSLGFDRWDEPAAHGPGAYFAVVSGRSLRDYADAMGENVWPTEECWRVHGADPSFYETVRDVSRSRDGAVVVGVDNVIQRQMVRFRDPSGADAAGPDERTGVEYAEWMGSRHMSALETSARDEVVATVTLSAEDGRVTVFRDGTFDARTRDELASEWRG
ncbi:diadenylate cyclase [Halococcus salsus]|uniref:diadenylate cyclase n=1 Tax=Halococcus salsus TaxID=2162894 RepID=UPI0013580F37|nr:diadenylate cyclase [Halococcus salsus]